VSLDEEFTNLIKYQKAFQASARIIKTASDMLDQLVALI
jgi:flagellar hook-associated protein 1 FlgK